MQQIFEVYSAATTQLVIIELLGLGETVVMEGKFYEALVGVIIDIEKKLSVLGKLTRWVIGV